MKAEIKNGIIGFIAGLIANAVFYYLQNSAYWKNLNINVQNSQIYIYLGLPILLAVLFIIGGILRKRNRDRWSFLAGGSYGRPLIETTRGTITMFGVKWRVTIGFGGSRNNEAYVEGCYCPNCDCELDDSTENKYFGWKQIYIWRCPSCGFKQIRPKEYLHDERDAVRKVALREYERQQR